MRLLWATLRAKRMEHLILAIYLLLFTSGFAGLAALAFLALRLRSGIVRSFMTIQGLFLLGLLFVLTYYYLGNIVSVGAHGSPVPGRLLGLAASVVQALLYFAAFRMVLSLGIGGKFRRWLRSLTAGICMASSVAALLSALNGTLLLVGLPHLALNSPLVSAIGFIIVGLALLFAGISLLTAPAAGEHSAIVVLIRGWGVALIAFVPLSVAEWALEYFSPISYAPLSLDFLFYFACSVVALVAFARSLRVERLGSEPAYKMSVGDDAAARFGLTLRERDMVPLIARGLANKEIASELGISEATVRTHIYNLFQKVGARSRIELLNRLAD